MYDERTIACRLFKFITDSAGDTSDNPQAADYDDAIWTQGMPWLYYSQDVSVQDLLDSTLDLRVAFELDEENSRTATNVDSLTFYLARYSIEGEFQGYQELKTQLSVCPMTYSDVAKMK